MFDIDIDFETRSKSDLKKVGAYNYATDPTTEILCCGFKITSKDIEDAPVAYYLWFPHDGPLPEPVMSALKKVDEITAHNAAFDQLIYEFVAEIDHDWPNIKANKWRCSSARARLNNMPAGLGNLTNALNSENVKDHTGAALIRYLSIPDKETGEFRENAEKLVEMGAYCLKDVKAMTSIKEDLRPMSDLENFDWYTNEQINYRGIKIDREMATAAMKYADAEQSEIAEELIELTGGVITKHTQSARVRDYVHERLCETGQKIMKVWDKKKECSKLSLDKNIRQQLLDRSDELDIPWEVCDIMQAVQDGSKSSVSKFRAMLDRADPNTDRVHGAFIHAGAGQTHRYASRGLQLHNFPRKVFPIDEVSILRKQMIDGKPLRLHGEDLGVMDTLSRLLRSAIIPATGHCFVVGDWSSIEAGTLPWLADNTGGRERIKDIENDIDLYEVAAAQAGYAGNRQIGKVAELALGYGGAQGAFKSMAAQFGLHIEEPEAKRIVNKWRSANPWAVDFWNKLEKAAHKAMKYPEEVFEAGRIRYVFKENHLDGCLFCILPDDTILSYPSARLEVVETQYGPKRQLTAMKANWTPAQGSSDWPRIGLWRGLLAENVTQATAAALLRTTLRSFNETAVGHVHDEIILEVPLEHAKAAKKVLQDTMESGPDWAEGLPLSAPPTIMLRYGK